MRAAPSKTRITLLQHPREARNPISTARMAHLSLPGSRLIAGVDFSRIDLSDAVVLFPGPGARDAAELRGRNNLHVVVVDGTWSQARKIWQRNPVLQALPAYALAPKKPGQYRIRKEPAPHCLATIEAIAELLELVEDRDPALLLSPFNAMVEHQLTFVAKPTRRHRVVKKEPRLLRLPALRQDIVLACAAKENEGEITLHAARNAERWQGSAAALAAWSQDATIICWGQYVPEQLGAQAQTIDLKPLLRDFYKQKLGHAEQACTRLELSPSPKATRGEQRLACLQALWEKAQQATHV